MNIYPQTTLDFLNISVSSGTTSAKITPGDFTVQNVFITRQGTAGDTIISCGSTEAFHSWNVSGQINFDTIFYCPVPITVTTPNQAWIGLTGMPGYHMGTATPVFLVSTSTAPTTATTSATSTPVASILNGFTYGEVMQGFFLFAIFVILFFGGILNRLVGVKQKARAYNELKNSKDQGYQVVIEHDS